MAQNSKAIGIDLGTTNSCVGVWRNGRVEIIANDMGSRITPSVVAYTNIERLVGEPAKILSAENPTNTIYGVKRIMGRKFQDRDLQMDMKGWPFRVTHAANKPKISVTYRNEIKQITPEEISAVILTKMKEIAEQYLEQEVTHAVITVPSSFNDSQRKATIDAGKIAGLTVVNILNEPTAAAIAYGMDKRIGDQRNVLVFDMGGGTFDVSILSIQDGNFEVKAVSGDSHLGGEDIDNTMLFHCVKDFKSKHKRDMKPNKKAMMRLKSACESAKKDLSTRQSAKIVIDSLHDGIDYSLVITRSRFEEINAPLFSKTLKTVEKAMKDAKMSTSDIDDILLVGGSTRVPKIQQLLQGYFNGKNLNRGINPDEAVAYGAAIQAAKLQGDKFEAIANLRLVDVTPLSMGIEIENDTAWVLIPRNTAIPAKKTMEFPTSVDNQEAIGINIFEGEHKAFQENKMLGTFILQGIPPAPKGHVTVEITFEIDSNGILNVSAIEKTSRSENKIAITNNQGRLSADDVARLMQEARINSAEDKQQRNLAFAKTRLQEYMMQIRDGMKFTLKNKIPPVAKKNISDQCSKIEEMLSSNQVNSVHGCEVLKKDLEELMKPFSGNLR